MASTWPPKGRFLTSERSPESAAPDQRPGHRTEYPASFPVTVSISRTAGKMIIPVRQTVRATDLLAAEKCSSPCLLATEDGDCACRCGGEFHGALIDAEVAIDPTAWTGNAILRDAQEDAGAGDRVTRRELRQLPFSAPASVLRLRLAMLAWDCGAREAAKRIGMTGSTFYKATAHAGRNPARNALGMPEENGEHS